MSAIKFGESPSKFVIPIALLEKFGSSTFITGIEISHMTRHSNKPNKLRNVNPVRGRTEIFYIKIKVIALIINFG